MTAKVTGDGSIFLTERASAAADVAGDGQIWVDDAVPNTLFLPMTQVQIKQCIHQRLYPLVSIRLSWVQ